MEPRYDWGGETSWLKPPPQEFPALRVSPLAPGGEMIAVQWLLALARQRSYCPGLDKAVGVAERHRQ